ncbi:MAG: chaperone DnaJ domain protein [Conexibacter sp.]|nr:chaperone DnaJ domain protein [Conexibacter sp.]
MPTAYRDYYEALGVPRDASDDEIRSAYRTFARRNHPDVNKEPGAEDRFREVSEAYEVLRDPERRAQYDRLGANWRAGQDVSGAQGFRPQDFGDEDGGVRFDFGGGGGGGGGGFGGGFGGADFSDFFEGLFGGRGAGTRRPAAGGGFSTRGGDHEAVLELSLEEAAAGGRRRVTLADGRDYEVEIPPGVRDGQRIRLAGEGGAGVNAGPSGDLFLRVRLRPHPRFRREGPDGRDLVTDLPVAPWEAVLGARIPVRTLTGTARVQVPPGSSSGRRLRLRGQGMPGRRGEPSGDLLAVVKIVVPRSVSAEERRLWEQLAETSDFDPRAGE